MRKHIGQLLLASALVATGWGALAADGIESRPLQFVKGASSATVKGSLAGDKTIDYKLRAKAGQMMSVKLETSNAANYFNVLPPDSNDVAIFIGSTSGNEWRGALPADGEYAIRVYLMRSAARRNEVANYTLTVGITSFRRTNLDRLVAGGVAALRVAFSLHPRKRRCAEASRRRSRATPRWQEKPRPTR